LEELKLQGILDREILSRLRTVETTGKISAEIHEIIQLMVKLHIGNDEKIM
jgi:hypothetical protein